MTFSRILRPSLLLVRLLSFGAGAMFFSGLRSCIHYPGELGWISDFLMSFVVWKLGSQAADKLRIGHTDVAENDASS
jgi:hypothetical protein